MRAKRRRLLIFITIGAFLLLGCSSIALIAVAMTWNRRVIAPVAVKRIVYGLAVMPDGFDPHINSSYEMGVVLRSVYDTLVYRDPQTKDFVPGLAEKWTVSDDGLTYTFTLRKGVRFHDDTPFNAQAVAANLDRITNPATRSQRAITLLGPYDHYTVVDPQTIQIVLKSPYAPLL